MGTPPEPTDQEVRSGAVRKLLEDVDLTFVPDAVERRIDERLAGALARSQRFRHVTALVERGGWYAADAFMAWLRAKLDAPLADGRPRGYSGLSLAAFYEKTGTELSMVASDSTDARMLVLNHRTAPECPVVWAVRMSMSIPLVWDEVIWRHEWGRYRERSVAGHAIVDGGLLSNFPIELFISDAEHVVRLMGPKSKVPPLGLLIDERLPVDGTRSRGLIEIRVEPGELRTVQRLQRLVDTATTAHDKMVSEEYEHLVARLPAAGYGTTEFDMSEERRAALVAAGADAMSRYLDAREHESSRRSRRDRALSPPSGNADRLALRILE